MADPAGSSVSVLANGVRVLRNEGPRAAWNAAMLRFFDLAPAPKAFIPSSIFELDDATLAAHAAVVSRFDARTTPRRLRWLVPRWDHPMAGINCILHTARGLEALGVESDIVTYDPGTLDHVCEKPADAVVATRWDSCYIAARMNDVQAKYYYVQDLEPLMYPAGTLSALAEETYRMGFARLCITKSVYDATRAYGGASMWFDAPVDWSFHGKHHADDPFRAKPEAPIRIVFYGRPTNDRNGFGLGVAALKLVKRKYGARVEILSVGAAYRESDYGLEGVVRNLGVLKDLAALGELYASCHIGFSLIYTTHPSFQPLEHMANHCAVVMNHNPLNAWILRDGENCLTARSNAAALAARIGELVDSKELRESIAKAGYATVAPHTWKKSVQTIYDFMGGKDHA